MGGRLIKQGSREGVLVCLKFIFWEASFYWVVTLLHGKQDKSVIDTIFTFIDFSTVCGRGQSTDGPEFKTQSPSYQPICRPRYPKQERGPIGRDFVSL